MNQDWNEIEALRESLREHMAEIHRLRAAGRHALEALEEYQQKGAPFMSCDAAVDALRSALAESTSQESRQVEPLMDEQITELFHGNSDKWWRVDHSEFCSIARAIERVHGIFANGENSIKQPNTEQEPVAGEYAICLEDGERVLISAVFPVGYGGNKHRTVCVVWPDGIEGAFSLFSFSKLFSSVKLKEKNT